LSAQLRTAGTEEKGGYLAALVGGEEPEEDLANGPMGTWAAAAVAQ